MDIIHLIMVLFTLLVPWRGVELLKVLVENDLLAPIRVAEKCLQMMLHSEEMLLEYRRGIAPLLNSTAKKIYEISSGKKCDLTSSSFFRSRLRILLPMGKFLF